MLLVDIGNTRIKWAHLHGPRLGRSQAAVHSAWSTSTYARRLFGRGTPPTQLWVTSVAGPGVNRALAAAARAAGVAAKFVAVPRSGGGVKVGYLEPWRLGSDRFVAAVGAHELFPRVPVCVVGVGTAMTLDLLAGDGRHRGGAIIPAPALMVDTLLTRTHGIQRRARGGRSSGPQKLFARSTRAALVDRAVEEAEALLGRTPLVVITGGQAGTVRTLLRSSCVVVPDLVLRGLAVLARREARGPQEITRLDLRRKPRRSRRA